MNHHDRIKAFRYCFENHDIWVKLPIVVILYLLNGCFE